MKIQRTKNALRNTLFGAVSKVYQMIIPFCMRTVMLYTLGVNYLGLNSLFSSILQVLNLAELGVGSAMVFSMYKPIAEDDEETICALMSLYRKYYRIIGAVIGGLGIALLPVLPRLVKSDLPADVNLYVLYLLNLGSTVATYWLFAYKNSLINAHQRTDIESKVSLVLSTVQYILQIGALAIAKSYYLYLIVMLLMQIGRNISVSLIVDRMYPNYKPKGELPKEKSKAINQKIRDLFTQKINATVFASVDTLVISSFLGLTALAIYQNYYLVISSAIGIIVVIFDACRAGIGNSLETETLEKNYNDFKKMTLLIHWGIAVASCGLICLYQHFMVMWVGRSLLLELPLVILFVVLFYFNVLGKLFDAFKDAAGIWHKDRFRPLCSSMLNLGLNLIMVHFIGLYGIILSTVLSLLLVSFPWELHNIFSCIFNRSILEYLGLLAKNVAVTIVTCIFSYWVCSKLPDTGIVMFIVKGMIAFSVANIFLFAVYSRTKEFSELKGMAARMLRRR